MRSLLLLVGGLGLLVFVLLRRSRRIQRSFERKDRRLVLALAASRAAVFEYDPEAREVVFAQDFSQVTGGFDPSELPSIVDRWEWWIDRVQAEDSAELIESLARIGDGEVDNAQLELRVKHREGGWIHLDVHLHRSASEGEAQKIIGVLRDVTAQRQSEEQRRDLVAKVAQSNRLEALGRLAGGVAHDFNNLLTVINGNAELARDSETQEEVSTLLGEIRDAGDNATALTRQLLQFSRREPGRRKPLDINRVVATLDRILRRLIGSSIDLRTELAPDAGWILGDRSQIEQVLVNLVTNARDALPRGGHVVIETRSGTASGGAPLAILTVRDDGVGMSESVMNQMYDPFFSTKPRGRGTGLGLSTVYGIVRETGGDIEVQSKPGAGAEFSLSWPRLDPETQDFETNEPGELTGNEMVLVVEDDPKVSRVIRTTLEQSGYGVAVAGDGEEALAALRLAPRTIQLVVSDVMMPRMGGFELLDRIRRRYPGLPVVLVSGYVDRHTREDADRDVRLLDKPFTRQRLLSEIRSALDQAEVGSS